jgi:hypothetical protein
MATRLVETGDRQLAISKTSWVEEGMSDGDPNG